jgi:hypothetical protein
MLRHSKNASHWLQLVAKKSLSTVQILAKRNIKHRSLLLQMFIEIFIKDGYLPIAEEMLSSSLADAAYTENPQLIAYSAILTVTKAISYVNEKIKNNLEIKSFSLEDIMMDPILFYHTVISLQGTSSLTGKGGGLEGGRTGSGIFYQSIILVNISLYFHHYILCHVQILSKNC